ncbi:SDR family NAD(P)-dependent oxidoreductase [Alicyclobacillus fodiniaquatilis]|uniref:SDR family NAD(P)-dependent oxidoreductase n=1 Tax=Alicyclobacillus fodiniaquatilis TaxID=1661150 RepID=A0ABW4JLU2_9BACL
MLRLAGRVAIVTGGAHGIGASIVEVLAENGADVAIFDWQLDEKADAVIASACENQVWAKAFQVDVSSSEQVNQAIQEVFDERQRIDILVNNAGICPFCDLLSMTDEIWERTINVNLTGMFYTARAVAPIMIRQQRGAIINISTVSTQICSPHQVHYIASKGGVDAFTRALSLAMSPYHVRVNAVAPLGVSTAINANVSAQKQAWEKTGLPQIPRYFPLPHRATSRDYANGVLYLASDEAAYVTGIVLPIDGGALTV